MGVDYTAIAFYGVVVAEDSLQEQLQIEELEGKKHCEACREVYEAGTDFCKKCGKPTQDVEIEGPMFEELIDEDYLGCELRILDKLNEPPKCCVIAVIDSCTTIHSVGADLIPDIEVEELEIYDATLHEYLEKTGIRAEQDPSWHVGLQES